MRGKIGFNFTFLFSGLALFAIFSFEARGVETNSSGMCTGDCRNSAPTVTSPALLNEIAQSVRDSCIVRVDVSHYVCADTAYDYGVYKKLYSSEAPKKIWENEEALRTSALHALGLSDTDVEDFERAYHIDPLPPLFDPSDAAARVELGTACRRAQVQRLALSPGAKPQTMAVPIDSARCKLLNDFAARHNERHALAFGKPGPTDVELSYQTVVLPLGTEKKSSSEIYDTVLDKLGIDKALRAQISANPSALDQSILAKSGVNVAELRASLDDLKQQLSSMGSVPHPDWLTYASDGSPVLSLKTRKLPAFSPERSRLDLIDENKSCALGVDVSSFPCGGDSKSEALWRQIYPNTEFPRQKVSPEVAEYYKQNYPDYDPTIRTITPDYVQAQALDNLELNPEEAHRYELDTGHSPVPPWTDSKNDADQAQFLSQCQSAQKRYLSRTRDYHDPNDWLYDSTFAVPLPDCKQVVSFAKHQSAQYRAEHHSADSDLIGITRSYAQYKYQEDIDPNMRKKWQQSRYPLLAEIRDRCWAGIKNPVLDSVDEFGDALTAIGNASLEPCGPEKQEAYEKLQQIQSRMKQRAAEEHGADFLQNPSLSSFCLGATHFATNTAIMGIKTAPAAFGPGGAVVSSALWSVGAAGSSYDQAALRGDSSCAAAKKGMESALLTMAFFEASGGAMGKVTGALDRDIAEAASKNLSTHEAVVKKLYTETAMSCAQMSMNVMMNNVIAKEPNASVEDILKGTGQACAQAVAMKGGMAGGRGAAAKLGQIFKKVQIVDSRGKPIPSDSPVSVGTELKITSNGATTQYKVTHLDVATDSVVVTAADGSGKQITTRLSAIKEQLLAIRGAPAKPSEEAEPLEASSVESQPVESADETETRTNIKLKMDGWLKKRFSARSKELVKDIGLVDEALSEEGLTKPEADKLAKQIDDGVINQDTVIRLLQKCENEEAQNAYVSPELAFLNPPGEVNRCRN